MLLICPLYAFPNLVILVDQKTRTLKGTSTFCWWVIMLYYRGTFDLLRWQMKIVFISRPDHFTLLYRLAKRMPKTLNIRSYAIYEDLWINYFQYFIKNLLMVLRLRFWRNTIEEKSCLPNSSIKYLKVWKN
jgi:hypothetical protein